MIKQSSSYSPKDLTITQYPFPIIQHIDDVKRVVNGLPEFVFRYRDGYIFCSYKIVTSETFPIVPYQKLKDPVYKDYLFRREIRGLVFDELSGKIVARCIHKFFNIGERLDSSIEVVQNLIEYYFQLKQSIYLMEKLDGSMVSPLLCNDRVRFRTKMGFNNDTSNSCELKIYGTCDISSWPTINEILEKYSGSENENERILYFCIKWISYGFTPIFEYYSKDTMIVIEYPTSFFTLTAIRNTETGEYVSYPDMKQHASHANIPIVPATEITYDQQPTEAFNTVKNIKGKEGCVLRFPDGQMFKLKSDWYCDLHRIKQHLVFNAVNEGHVWALVFDEKMDDAIPLLNEYEQKALKSFNDDLLKAVISTAATALAFSDQYKNYSQKEYAQLVKNTTKNTTWSRILFLVRNATDASDAQDHVISVLRLLLFKDLKAARILLQAPHLQFFENYLRRSNKD
jgi:RNA ligase